MPNSCQKCYYADNEVIEVSCKWKSVKNLDSQCPFFLTLFSLDIHKIFSQNSALLCREIVSPDVGWMNSIVSAWSISLSPLVP